MKKSLTVVIMVALALVLVFSGACAKPAPAPTPGEEPIEKVWILRHATYMPWDHAMRQMLMTFFQDRVTEETGGRIIFEEFAPETLCSAGDQIDALLSGVAGFTSLDYSHFPLPFVLQLPGYFTDPEMDIANEALHEIYKSEYLLPEFEKRGVKYICSFVTPNYQLGLSEEWGPAKSLADFQGAKLKVSGAVLPHTWEALGATPVGMTSPESYDALAKGVIDGTVQPVMSQDAYPTIELLPYHLLGFTTGGYPSSQVVSLEMWNKWSPDIQEIIMRVADETMGPMQASLYVQYEPVLDKWREQGKEVYELSDEDKALVKEKTAEVVGTWLTEMEADGYSTVRQVLDMWVAEMDKRRAG